MVMVSIAKADSAALGSSWASHRCAQGSSFDANSLKACSGGFETFETCSSGGDSHAVGFSVEFVSDTRAHLDAPTDFGKTPLMMASELGYTEVCGPVARRTP
eukprot:4890259-Amphidinium_carterae.1